jgi:protein TonB
MNKVLLYRPPSKGTAIAAFAIAAVIHLSAVAYASFHRDVAQVPVAFSDPPVDGTDVPIDPPPVVELDPIPPIQSAPPESEFVESAPPPVRHPMHERAPTAAHPSTSTGLRIAGFSKALTVSAPRPEYPYEARRRHLVGSGIVIVSVDPISGAVTDAEVSPSIGDAILDRAAVSAFRRWRFKPGTPARVKIPITFNLAGASYW